MATLASVSTPPGPALLSRRSFVVVVVESLSKFSVFNNNNRFRSSSLPLVDRKRLLLPPPLKCSSSDPPPTQNDDSESQATSSSYPSPGEGDREWAYKLCAGIGGMGFLETTYLSYLNLSHSTAFCPLSAGACADVLNSDYAVVFGVPLSLIGMVSYGVVATLGINLSQKRMPFGLVESDGRHLLLWSSTSMAAASADFLYILTTKFSPTSCPYCLLSVLLSFTLFFITLKDFGLKDIQKEVGLQLCIASFVVLTLNSSYSASPSGPVPPRLTSFTLKNGRLIILMKKKSKSFSFRNFTLAAEKQENLDDINLPYFTTEIMTTSSPYALSLAKHLNSIGAKMYGAFWCSHCVEQKEMFGRDAAKLLNYVECFPNGFSKGTKMEKECSDIGIEGFPTWVIKGQKKSGELEFSELAEASGFTFDEVSQSTEDVQ